MRPRLVAAVLAAAAWAGCSGGGGDGGGDAAARTGPEQRATATEVPLQVGQCADLDRIRAGIAIDPAALRTVPCEQAHSVEVGAVFDYSAGAEVGFPGRAAVDNYATDECLQRFESYVGAPYEASTLDFVIVAPDENGWDAGDRRVACVLYHVDFAPLTGSVAGSGL